MVPALDQQALERLHRLVFDRQPLPPLPRLRPVRVGWHWPRRRMRRWGAVGLEKATGRDRYLVGVQRSAVMVSTVYRGRSSPTITIRANPSEKAELVAMAAEVGLNISDLVRTGLALVQAEITAGTFAQSSDTKT
jgi:hypothetical protein